MCLTINQAIAGDNMNTLRQELITRLTTVENNYQRGYRSSSQHYNDLARIRDDMYYNRYYIDHSDLYEALNNTLEELV